MPNEFLTFANDPDQMSREAELRDFIGPNADKFLTYYRNMLPGPNGRPAFKLFGAGFNPGAFFGGPVWFFYRKLWAWAWGITGLIVILSFLPFPRGVGIGLGAGLAAAANRVYLSHAISKLTRLRSVNGFLDPAAVRQAGGVSTTAGWVSGVIYVGVTILGILAMIYLASKGQPIS